MNSKYCPIIIALSAILLQPAIAELQIIKSGLCNFNKIIIKTGDRWYAAGIYVDGVRLNPGDRLLNEEIYFSQENHLQLISNGGAGNYLITTVEETQAEAEATVCN